MLLSVILTRISGANQYPDRISIYKKPLTWLCLANQKTDVIY